MVEKIAKTNSHRVPKVTASTDICWNQKSGVARMVTPCKAQQKSTCGAILSCHRRRGSAAFFFFFCHAGGLSTCCRAARMRSGMPAAQAAAALNRRGVQGLNLNPKTLIRSCAWRPAWRSRVHRLVCTSGTVPERTAHHAKEGDVVAAEAQLDERYHNQENIHLRRVSGFEVSNTTSARRAFTSWFLKFITCSTCVYTLCCSQNLTATAKARQWSECFLPDVGSRHKVAVHTGALTTGGLKAQGQIPSFQKVTAIPGKDGTLRDPLISGQADRSPARTRRRRRGRTPRSRSAR